MATGKSLITGAPALVLFDIDGTLIRRAGPHHRQALVDAVRHVTGLETTTDHIPVHGMLDPDILTRMMLDADATPSRREFQRTPGLNGPAVSRAWGHYLGHAAASAQHVPAHRANLEGLPPTFVSCSEIDPCRDEAIDYANRLLHAYVHTELHVVAATFNGFDAAVPDWVVSQENQALHAQSLQRSFDM